MSQLRRGATSQSRKYQRRLTTKEAEANALLRASEEHQNPLSEAEKSKARARNKMARKARRAARKGK